MQLILSFSEPGNQSAWKQGITELTLTVWHCYQGHSHNGRGTCAYLSWICACLVLSCNKLDTENLSTISGWRTVQSFKEQTQPSLASKFRGSTPCTGQTWRGWISVLVRQRWANYAYAGLCFCCRHMFQLLFSIQHWFCQTFFTCSDGQGM